MQKLELSMLGKTFECRDGDVVGKAGNIGKDVLASAPGIADRHLLVGRQEGGWFVMVPLNVATPTRIAGQPAPHGVRFPVQRRLDLHLGELALCFSEPGTAPPPIPTPASPPPLNAQPPPLASAPAVPEAPRLPIDLPFLHQVVDRVGDLIAVIDENGRRIWNNAAYAKVLGYNPEELRGTVSISEVHPDDQPLVKSVAEESMRTGLGRRIEYRMRHRDQSWVWLESEGSVIEDESGRKRLAIIARDVTRRKAAEAEIEAANRRQLEQAAALTAFTRSKDFHAGNVERCLAMIAEAICKTTSCDRSSVWLTDAATHSLVCEDCFTASSAKHSAGEALHREQHPQYFSALSIERFISAPRAFEHPALSELRLTYLGPHNIVSKLDVAIERGEELIGVLCCETTTARSWTIDEQGFLASLADLVLLTIETRQRMRTLQALKESQRHLAQELSEAAAYVTSLLPEPLPAGAGAISAEWICVPSRELGGDAFGYQWLDEDHFSFYVLDVAGHGVRAALLSVAVMNALRSDPTRDLDLKDPALVLQTLNRQFQMSDRDEMYFTIWYGVYDRSTHAISYSAAGHPPALLFPASADAAAEPAELRAPALMIGASPDATFVTHSQALDPKAHDLYLFTDGAYELPRPDGSVTALPEFVTTLKQHRQGPLTELLAETRAACGAAELPDDFTIIKLKVPPRSV